jgi:hypothetical protein
MRYDLYHNTICFSTIILPDNELPLSKTITEINLSEITAQVGQTELFSSSTSRSLNFEKFHAFVLAICEGEPGASLGLSADADFEWVFLFGLDFVGYYFSVLIDLLIHPLLYDLQFK